MSKLRCIIGIRGSLQSGKSTVGQFLARSLSGDFRVSRRSFADNLRDSVALIFGFDKEYVYSEEFKNTDLHVQSPSGRTLSGRELLQYFGTNICRTMDEDCWARGPITWFRNHGVEIGIITDLRFPNEVQAIRNNEIKSVIIKVERPGYCGGTHASERSLDHCDDYDHAIENTGSLEDLEHECNILASIIEGQLEIESYYQDGEFKDKE